MSNSDKEIKISAKKQYLNHKIVNKIKIKIVDKKQTNIKIKERNKNKKEKAPNFYNLSS